MQATVAGAGPIPGLDPRPIQKTKRPKGTFLLPFLTQTSDFNDIYQYFGEFKPNLFIPDGIFWPNAHQLWDYPPHPPTKTSFFCVVYRPVFVPT